MIPLTSHSVQNIDEHIMNIDEHIMNLEMNFIVDQSQHGLRYHKKNEASLNVRSD